jgi:hypothetical protein
MDRFPLPQEVMCVIFEKSRELKRVEGRNKMLPTIASFQKTFRRSLALWTIHFENPIYIPCHTPKWATTIVRSINIPLPYSRPYFTKMFIKFFFSARRILAFGEGCCAQLGASRRNMRYMAYHSGSHTEDIEDLDDDIHDQGSQMLPSFPWRCCK